jgi:putative membrane protein
MKRSVTGAALAAVIVAAGGSVYGQTPREPSGQTPSSTKSTTTQQKATASAADKTFAHDMAVAGMAEVQLGKLAAERASNPDVKAFAQTMVKDHSQAGDELKQTASTLNIQLPTQLDQKHKDLAARLTKLQGAEFDKQYMAAMVQGHEEVLSKLNARSGQMTSNTAGAGNGSPASATATSGATPSASKSVGTSGQGNALTDWAKKVEPTVKEHLEKARDIQKKVAQ